LKENRWKGGGLRGWGGDRGHRKKQRRRKVIGKVEWKKEDGDSHKRKTKAGRWREGKEGEKEKNWERRR
jgi:hypothetical protein